jgi:hypothetical protein
MTLHNLFSLVFRSAPSPKLLLLEKWYRSEKQQVIQRPNHKVEVLLVVRASVPKM